MRAAGAWIVGIPLILCSASHHSYPCPVNSSIERVSNQSSLFIFFVIAWFQFERVLACVWIIGRIWSVAQNRECYRNDWCSERPDSKGRRRYTRIVLSRNAWGAGARSQRIHVLCLHWRSAERRGKESGGWSVDASEESSGRESWKSNPCTRFKWNRYCDLTAINETLAKPPITLNEQLNLIFLCHLMKISCINVKKY